MYSRYLGKTADSSFFSCSETSTAVTAYLCHCFAVGIYASSALMASRIIPAAVQSPIFVTSSWSGSHTSGAGTLVLDHIINHFGTQYPKPFLHSTILSSPSHKVPQPKEDIRWTAVTTANPGHPLFPKCIQYNDMLYAPSWCCRENWWCRRQSTDTEANTCTHHTFGVMQHPQDFWKQQHKGEATWTGLPLILSAEVPVMLALPYLIASEKWPETTWVDDLLSSVHRVWGHFVSRKQKMAKKKKREQVAWTEISLKYWE